MQEKKPGDKIYHFLRMSSDKYWVMEQKEYLRISPCVYLFRFNGTQKDGIHSLSYRDE